MNWIYVVIELWLLTGLWAIWADRRFYVINNCANCERQVRVHNDKIKVNLKWQLAVFVVFILYELFMCKFY